MRPIYFLLAGALAVTACSQEVTKTASVNQTTTEQTQNATGQDVKTISTDEAKTVLETEKDLVVLDVRTPEEYAGGHLQNAVLINKYDSDFEAKIKALDREKPYLVYCASGVRSGQAKEMMKALGFKKVYDAKGFEGLKAAGVPVE
ncbi:MAG TPA: rhodanese-like domain-containing protein [Adhaeribacter sp.]|nr:rhodanese-like domain-containing protein [Adhaeribacter sp.]